MKVVTVELLDKGKGNFHDLADLPNLLAEEVTVNEEQGWICSGGITAIQRQRDDGIQTILMQPMVKNNSFIKWDGKKYISEQNPIKE